MATSRFQYKEDSENSKDIVELTSKCRGEALTGVTYINPEADLDYKFTVSDTYTFIPYNPGTSSDIWAQTPVVYRDAYKSTSTNTVHFSNSAAWGTAPIPIRFGLKNISSIYIDILKATIENDSSYDLYMPGGCACAIVDVVAKGGDGGNGYVRYAAKGGGGGGSGAMASLLIDFRQTGTVTFKSDTNQLKISCSNSDNTITLGNGSNGGNATRDSWGAGGSGGSDLSGAIPGIPGIEVQWSSAGKNGGRGGGGQGATGGTAGGFAGESGPTSITFLNTDYSLYTSGGGGAGGSGNADPAVELVWGGGGGGGCIFGSGGKGGDVGTAGVNGGSGAGGGGGYATRSSTGAAGTGGKAYIKVYYESTSTSTYKPSSSGSGGGGGINCVFPGTQIFLDSTSSVDIAEFNAGNLIDFCNPDTLEHFPQQTLTKLYSQSATKKIIVKLEDGKNIQLTPDHVVLTQEGLKIYSDNQMFPKYDLEDYLATVDGYKKIVSIQEENINPTLVYNIVTENTLMVANGIIIAGELNLNIDYTAVDDNISKEHWGGDSGGVGGGGLIP